MKLEQAVHYIISKCPHPEKLGKTKLNKILWFADRETYIATGKPLTNAIYIKKQFGPVPRNIDTVIKKLIEAKKIEQQRKQTSEDYSRTLYTALQAPEENILSTSEMEILNPIIANIRDKHTAKGISEKSHDIAWDMAELDKEIPYASIHVSRIGKVTPEDIQWIQTQIANGEVTLKELAQ